MKNESDDKCQFIFSKAGILTAQEFKKGIGRLMRVLEHRSESSEKRNEKFIL